MVLNGITVDIVNKNPHLIVKLLGLSLGIPLDEIEINDTTETPNGILIDFCLPESAEIKPELTAQFTTTLQNQPGFEDATVTSAGKKNI